MKVVGMAALVVAGALLVPGVARAGLDGGQSSSLENDVETLERQLNEEHTALSTADCQVACRALMSIRRAADKICALEPGPRCDAAREKAGDATRRVHEACPDCVIAAAPIPAPPQERAATQASPASEQTYVTAQEPRGGCRSCATTGSPGSGAETGLLVLAAAAAVRLVTRSKTNAARSEKNRRRL